MIALGTCLLTYCKKGREEYGLLSQTAFYEDFKDDDDETKETEIFRRPIKGKFEVQSKFFLVSPHRNMFV